MKHLAIEMVDLLFRADSLFRVSFIAGLLVSEPGGCQGGGGQAVYAGKGCGRAGGDVAGFGGESGRI